jgi:hypothetical protein
LTEEKRDATSGMCGRLNQPTNDSAEQHRLAFAEIALDPEQLALSTIALSLKIDIEEPAVRVSEEGTLLLLNAVLVVVGVSRL